MIVNEVVRGFSRRFRVSPLKYILIQSLKEIQMSNKTTDKKLEKKIKKLKKELAEHKRISAHFKSIFNAIPDAVVLTVILL